MKEAVKQKSQKIIRILVDNNDFTLEQATRIIACIAEYNTSQTKQLASKDDLKILKKDIIHAITSKISKVLYLIVSGFITIIGLFSKLI